MFWQTNWKKEKQIDYTPMIYSLLADLAFPALEEALDPGV